MIRPIRPDELDEVCRRITSIDPWKMLGIRAEDLAARVRADDKRATLIYEENGELLGAIIFRMEGMEMLFGLKWGPHLAQRYGTPWPCDYSSLPPAAYVGSLAVFPGAQGKGIGPLLLGEIENRARALGLHRIYLMVTDRNARAKDFYQRGGYTAIAHQDDCIQPGNREWLMEKNLVSAAPPSV